MRRGGLRRLHRRFGAAQGWGARLRADQRLHSAPGPARRSGADHDRGPRRGRRTASAAAGNGRSPRFAMRFLHAWDRHEFVRGLSFRGAPDIQRALRPACRQSLPMHRLSPDHRGRARDLRRRRRRSVRGDGGNASGRAGRPRRQGRRVRRRRRLPSSPRRRASTLSRRSTPAFPTPPCVAGATDVGFGSPSSCATSGVSSGLAGSPG